MAMTSDNVMKEAVGREERLVSALTGNKVYLRGVEVDDLPKRVRWINDPKVQRTLSFQCPMSEIKARSWLQAVSNDTSRRDLSICTRASDEYIGFGGFLSIDPHVQKAELYITVGDKRFWNRGYGTDAYAVLTRYGFLELGLNRIYSHILSFNRPSLRCVQRLGWSVEGILRQDIFSHGELCDRAVASLLRSDWLRQEEMSTRAETQATIDRGGARPDNTA